MPTFDDLLQGTRNAWEQFKDYAKPAVDTVNQLTWAPSYAKAVGAIPYIVKGQEIPEGLVPHPPSWEERKTAIKETVNQMRDPQHAAMSFQPGAMGYLAPNFRSPEVIQALRKKMAEEMRSRGVIPSVEQGWQVSSELLDKAKKNFWWADNPTLEMIQRANINPELAEQIGLIRATKDPIEQILRGSWYHGLSSHARQELVGRENLFPVGTQGFKLQTAENALDIANQLGFPLSLHDSASISNKLGEPAGVSLSMLPTKSKQFSADDYIHRVLPLDGGQPSERVVNLMTPEGRKALNDAYDIVMNRELGQKANLEELSHYLGKGGSDIDSYLQEVLSSNIGHFNKQLSDALQSSGYRHILYNPKRWDEYEMLALDPKYVLPLDYRKMGEYLPKRLARGTMLENIGPQAAQGSQPEITAAPGIQRGLGQIRDLMAQNKSRLGDIYSERPWTQRLSEENKNRILQMIDERYREQVGQQLYGR